MGDFLNQDVVQHCLLLAQECLEEDEFVASKYFLNCLDMAAQIFPELCAGKDIFAGMTSMFESCSNQNMKGKRKQTLQKNEIVTTLSSVLAAATPYIGQDEASSDDLEGSLQKRFVSLIREGTPVEVRNSVAAMMALSKPQNDSILTQDRVDAVLPLLKILASPSRLVVDETSSNSNLPCILAGLAVFGEQAPEVISTSSLGDQALKFAMDTVLLGRSRLMSSDDGSDEQSDSDSSDDEGATKKTPTQRRRLTKSRTPTTNLSPLATKDPVNDSTLSTSCRSICAAIEFLAIFIRSSIISLKSVESKKEFRSSYDQLIGKLFDTLSQILQDGGSAPSSRDRKTCSLRQCLAALRRTAAVWLLRLCETRLGLESKFLSTSRWNTLAGAFLDDEAAVREAVTNEFIDLMVGANIYNRTGKQPVRLRFLSYLSFCVDDNANHSVANGGAANIGKACLNAKNNGLETIVAVRQVYETAIAQARIQGDDAEEYFERNVKPSILPEYVLPYVISLLSFRDETPSAKDDQAGMRVLKKRLKNILEPLIESLGSNADNISFLLRCCETVSQKEPKDGGETELVKMKLVCGETRDVLLSMVQSDVNLASYPGQMYVPQSLFKKAQKKRKRSTPPKEIESVATSLSPEKTGRKVQKTKESSDESVDEEEQDTVNSPEKTDAGSPFSTSSRSTYSSRKYSKLSDMKSKSPKSKEKDSNSFFSDSRDERLASSSSPSPTLSSAGSPKGSVRFSLGSQLSPIHGGTPRREHSPASPARRSDSLLLDSDEKTRGTTPPSTLKPFSATASYAYENSSSSAPTPVSASTPATKSPDEKNTSEGKQRRKRRSPNQEKENTSSKTAKARRPRSSAPKKVKVVRGKASVLTNREKKLTNQTSKQSRVARNRSGKNSQSSDPFEF
eukprot:CAMPEP_0113469014 /NCGR_PEP_ID=MMETSP0014_2-20120614/15670_1 /TAXON_ID=2857 /ORGANISM="Nitzschia sp." /LENGTH=904 /DNA_ID=CAMNT_0000361457 /DNA_START=1 /DNA_END=2715 /DNA_ORIENTATION=- /assembly_acc=CAM_ASM_000159